MPGNVLGYRRKQSRQKCMKFIMKFMVERRRTNNMDGGKQEYTIYRMMEKTRVEMSNGEK